MFSRDIGSEKARATFNKSRRPRVLIYGAGSSGRQLAEAMRDSSELNVVGFLDDNKLIQGRVLNGLPIHEPSTLETLVVAKKIDNVLLAIPSASRRRRNEILKEIRKAKVSVSTIPSVEELAKGSITVSEIKELDVDDLLGREKVEPNQELLSRDIKDKVVLVTGAGGSIGGELCRQICAIGPRKLLLLEQSEFSLYSIHQELENFSSNIELVPLLASVQDEEARRNISYMESFYCIPCCCI